MPLKSVQSLEHQTYLAFDLNDNGQELALPKICKVILNDVPIRRLLALFPMES